MVRKKGFMVDNAVEQNRRIVPVKDLRLQAEFLPRHAKQGDKPLMTWVYRVEGIEGDLVKVKEEGTDRRNVLLREDVESGRGAFIVLTPLPEIKLDPAGSE